MIRDFITTAAKSKLQKKRDIKEKKGNRNIDITAMQWLCFKATR